MQLLVPVTYLTGKHVSIKFDHTHDSEDVTAVVDRDTLLLFFVIFAPILLCLYGNSLLFRVKKGEGNTTKTSQMINTLKLDFIVLYLRRDTFSFY